LKSNLLSRQIPAYIFFSRTLKYPPGNETARPTGKKHVILALGSASAGSLVHLLSHLSYMYSLYSLYSSLFRDTL
jgi:hypothetical protein